ncbi:nicotinamide riboside transporter PnuC [Lysobacter changpingensis]|uniref:nicotinamide riboside transporter PnuC n=1 Tax=Lysobacter changpingensis TaxID=2792784 RepID=UPI001F5D381F|nr:nicotinamide riboside transporter PnuC [Lysobacter changpingensis]
MATVSILLAGRNSVHTWWTGIVGCALFAMVFWGARLYADVLLQGFFIVTSVIGWYSWTGSTGKDDLPIRRTPQSMLVWMATAAWVAAGAYGWVLHRYTDAYAPFADSAVLAASVLAQLLLMRRRIETWPVWLLVNTIAVPLYASRGLTLTAVLYTVYWINAWLAWRHWTNQRTTAGATA